MKRYIARITLLISIILTLYSGYVLTDIYKSMKERQEIIFDLAAVNDVRYGIFNVDKWKVFISDLIIKKINELEIDTKMHETIREPVEDALYSLIDNIEKFLSQDKENGSWLQQMVKTVAYDIVFDAEKFRKEVPKWADEVVKQINTEANRQQIKSYLFEKIDSYLNETTTVNFDIQSYLTNKYEMTNYEECVNYLTKRAQDLLTHSWQLTWLLISIIIILFVIYFITPLLQRTEIHYYVLFSGVIILLLGGILTPMIDIDARIQDIQFVFLGEAIHFQDQVIFFQSKSVFDVVELLITEGNVQTISVGILIFTFSIIFPTLKFIFSVLSYRFPIWIKKHKITSFFVLRSAKWSMADVMVMAIFMSYIGFSSIVGAQLDFVSRYDNVHILSTHEHTSLQTGFFLFTAYCISGIIFGYVAEKVLNRKNDSHIKQQT